MECYKSHKLGHFQFECPDLEKQVNYAEFNEEEELLLMAHVELKGSRLEDVWFLDSGCSNHMTGTKKWFIKIDKSFRHSVKLGNGVRMTVQGNGSIKIKVNGLIQVVQDVYYVPELSNNLLSIGHLQERKLAVLIQDGVCKVYHPSKGLIIETPMSANRMFVVIAQLIDSDACIQIETTYDTHLWHCRFAHLNYNSLRSLSCKEMVKGLPQIDNIRLEPEPHCCVAEPNTGRGLEWSKTKRETFQSVWMHWACAYTRSKAYKTR